MAMPTPAAGAAPAVGTSAGASAAGSAVSGAIGLAGSWLQYLWQQKLMDKSYSQAVEQWEREAAYMTPEQQMKRFRDAGLNPDLIYGQMQNTNGSMPSVSTPQAPNVARDVSSAQLAESQRRLNDANAGKMEAETNIFVTKLKEMNETFDVRFQTMFEQLNLTKESINKLSAETTHIKESTGMLLYQVDYLESLTDLNRSQKRINDYIGNVWSVRSSFAYEQQQAELNDLIESAGLKGAEKQRIMKDVHYFAQTFDLYRQLTLSQVASNYASSDQSYKLGAYYNALGGFVKQQAQWFPFQMINSIDDPSKFQINKNGSILTDDDGIPKFDESYIRVKKRLGLAEGVLNTLGGGFRDVAIGWSVLGKGGKGGFGFGPGNFNEQMPGPIKKTLDNAKNLRPLSDDEKKYFNRLWQSATTKEQERRAINEMNKYCRKNGIKYEFKYND